MKKTLTIAGSDSGGGAGIQADLKIFHQFECYGMSALTAVTAQNTQGVRDVATLPVSIIQNQIIAIFEDFGVDALKTGMLSTSKIISAVAKTLSSYDIENLVIDPVMRAKDGSELLRDDAVDALIGKLMPLAILVTPNISEAEIMAETRITSLQSMQEAARTIYRKGAQNVLIKGGHLHGDATDIFFDGVTFKTFTAPRLKAKNTHGTGCVYSAAITANLALGYRLDAAIEIAKRFVTEAIKTAPDFGLGVGPLNHFCAPDDSDLENAD